MAEVQERNNFTSQEPSSWNVMRKQDFQASPLFNSHQLSQFPTTVLPASSFTPSTMPDANVHSNTCNSSWRPRKAPVDDMSARGNSQQQLPSTPRVFLQTSSVSGPTEPRGPPIRQLRKKGHLPESVLPVRQNIESQGWPRTHPRNIVFLRLLVVSGNLRPQSPREESANERCLFWQYFSYQCMVLDISSFM